MSQGPPHIAWFKTGRQLLTPGGNPVTIFEFQHLEDAAVLSAWAKHFREHYMLDEVLDQMRDGTGLSRKEYLLQLVFPHHRNAPGPSVRTGDFAEILVADYFEYVLDWRVPRTRYGLKAIPNESTKGTDFLGFGLTNATNLANEKYSVDDTLLSVEVKAQFTGRSAESKLQEAIDHSGKDSFRRALSLNAMKQRLFLEQDHDGAALVQRFQDEADRPFRSQYAAVAVFCNSLYDPSTATAVDASGHPDSQHLSLLVCTGDQMMQLVHRLYEIAADEA